MGELGKRLYDVQGQLGYYPGDLHRVRGGFGVNLHEQVGLRPFFFFFFFLSRSSRPTNRCSFGQLASFRSLPYPLICSDMCMAPANDATNPVNYIDPGFQVRALCECQVFFVTAIPTAPRFTLTSFPSLLSTLL